ncbi:hypothetical protein [Polaromonas sp. JS666]|uniref:hypothetical protein n=1 Tax=Polaromonas sp. (strain JS666 / ATCC BAA-500) TaxID=296591 RepID=UPI00059C6993|nr:hypothetical protein [Polaromonas sp. JS666]
MGNLNISAPKVGARIEEKLRDWIESAAPDELWALLANGTTGVRLEPIPRSSDDEEDDVYVEIFTTAGWADCPDNVDRQRGLTAYLPGPFLIQNCDITEDMDRLLAKWGLVLPAVEEDENEIDRLHSFRDWFVETPKAQTEARRSLQVCIKEVTYAFELIGESWIEERERAATDAPNNE